MLRAAGGSTTEKRGMKEILVDECLKNPQTLLFAMSYFCVYVGTGFRLLGLVSHSVLCPGTCFCQLRRV